MSADPIVVGVDLGAESTKIVLGGEGLEIVRNDVGGHSTPTVVAFPDRQPRQIGIHSNQKTAIYHLNRLIDGELSDGDVLEPFYTFLKDGKLVPVTYNGETTEFSPAALLGMLFSKVKENAVSTWSRLNSGLDAPPVLLALVCPSDLTARGRQELMDAAYGAGIDQVQLIDRAVACQATYSRKFPEYVDKYVMIVDMGHADTTASILGPEKSSNDEETKEEEAPTPAPVMKVLACRRQKGLGAGAVDVKLWKHFQSLKLTDLTPGSRGGQRLLAGMTKLKQLLSQLPEGVVTVENVGPNDTDVSLEGTRNMLVEVCADEVQALTILVEETLKAAGVEPESLFSVEVIGGGCRMPWVKETLERTTKISTLSFTLDDTSAALGAALLPPNPIVCRSVEDQATEDQVALRAAEEVMARADKDLKARSATLNQMEAHILGLRSAKHEAHGNLLPEELFSYMDTVEDWLFSPEVDEASHDTLKAKWEEVQAKTAELSKKYSEKVEADRKAKEAEMEEEAKQAQKERAGEEADEEDHDNRRLPKKRRMEIVMKNKKEGGELFSDGNFKFAAARYAKALSHCAKFVDLGPEDQTEVNEVKLTLNLNLALAYMKMQNTDQALRYSNDALAIDENHTKALYRRASIYYEKKNWEGASKDLKKALSNAPEDKAIAKLQEKVDAQIKRQKLKEKKMAQKMFG